MSSLLTTALCSLSDRENRNDCSTGAALTHKLEQSTLGRKATGTHNTLFQLIWNRQLHHRQIWGVNSCHVSETIRLRSFRDICRLEDAFSWATLQEQKQHVWNINGNQTETKRSIKPHSNYREAFKEQRPLIMVIHVFLTTQTDWFKPHCGHY